MRGHHGQRDQRHRMPFHVAGRGTQYETITHDLPNTDATVSARRCEPADPV